MKFDRRQFVSGAVAIGLPGSSAMAQGAGVQGHYIGALQLQPLPDGRHKKLLSPYTYRDRQGRRWKVPVNSVVDGASIPRLLWSIVGSPSDGPYLSASVIHDYYCDVRIRTWQDTHRMFHEAMLASNVNTTQARLMFLAVYYAGPSWDAQTIANNILATGNGEFLPPQRFAPPAPPSPPVQVPPRPTPPPAPSMSQPMSSADVRQLNIWFATRMSQYERDLAQWEAAVERPQREAEESRKRIEAENARQVARFRALATIADQNALSVEQIEELVGETNVRTDLGPVG